jgi:hypothetical protein
MSEEAYESGDAQSVPSEILHFLVPEEQEGGALRWTVTTMFIDLFNAIGLVMEGVASFFNGQARSLAARASLKEELADRALRQRLRSEERIRMQMHTMEDIAALPEAPEC